MEIQIYKILNCQASWVMQEGDRRAWETHLCLRAGKGSSGYQCRTGRTLVSPPKVTFPLWVCLCWQCCCILFSLVLHLPSLISLLHLTATFLKAGAESNLQSCDARGQAGKWVFPVSEPQIHWIQPVNGGRLKTNVKVFGLSSQELLSSWQIYLKAPEYQ